jgi:hypothetical protein
MHDNPNKQANLLKMPYPTTDRASELLRIQREAIADFRGIFDDLELAIGILHLGEYLGWKPLVLIHNKRTIRKVEEILQINVREFFAPEGVGAERSMGYLFAKKLKKFWKAVSGDFPVDHRREIGDSA